MNKIRSFLAGYFWFAVIATPIATLWALFGGIRVDAYGATYLEAVVLLFALPCVAVTLLLTNLALLYYWRPNHFWRVTLSLQLIGYAIVVYSVFQQLKN